MRMYITINYNSNLARYCYAINQEIFCISMTRYLETYMEPMTLADRVAVEIS